MQPGQPYGPSAAPAPVSSDPYASPGYVDPTSAAPYGQAPYPVPGFEAAAPQSGLPHSAPPGYPASPPYGAPPPAAYAPAPPYPGPPPYPAAGYGAAPYPGPYAAAGPYPGQPVPPHLVGAPPPPGLKIVRRSKASFSIIFPLVGLFIAGLVCPTLPWVDSGAESFTLWELMDNLWDAGSATDDTWGVQYAKWAWPFVFVWAAMVAFAGTLDNAGFRITYGIIYTLCSVGLAGMMLLGVLALLAAGSAVESSSGTTSSSPSGGKVAVLLIGGLICLVVLFVSVFLVFKLRGLAYRILAGLGLFSFALLHLVTVATLFGDAPIDAEPGAYLASFGYVLCAVGCFIGPKYIPHYDRA
ncbi:hypothetical protein [Cryptosporangium minutisporangium]|uniref:Uncharacterized protein n=1 Tax=Cryptosporangium minutisporangium TaxID=113569 RepID=A0ABP6T7S3_9ACTN